MSIPDKQSGGVPPSSTPNAAPNTNPMPAMSPFAAHFQEQRERKKNMLMRHIDRISLSSKLVACTMSMDVMGVQKEELMDNVTLGGVASYLERAEEANVNLFI